MKEKTFINSCKDLLWKNLETLLSQEGESDKKIVASALFTVAHPTSQHKQLFGIDRWMQHLTNNPVNQSDKTGDLWLFDFYKAYELAQKFTDAEDELLQVMGKDIQATIRNFVVVHRNNLAGVLRDENLGFESGLLCQIYDAFGDLLEESNKAILHAQEHVKQKPSPSCVDQAVMRDSTNKKLSY